MPNKNRPLLYYFDSDGKVVHFKNHEHLSIYDVRAQLNQEAINAERVDLKLPSFVFKLPNELGLEVSFAPEGRMNWTPYDPKKERVQWYWPPMHDGQMKFIKERIER